MTLSGQRRAVIAPMMDQRNWGGAHANVALATKSHQPRRATPAHLYFTIISRSLSSLARYKILIAHSSQADAVVVVLLAQFWVSVRQLAELISALCDAG